MVITALKKAFMVAKPVILNSDQGCQFTNTVGGGIGGLLYYVVYRVKKFSGK